MNHSMSQGVWTAVLVTAAMFGASGPVRAQTFRIEHSGWEMFHAGIVDIRHPTENYGDPSVYGDSPAIPPPGLDWMPLSGSAPGVRNPSNINYLGPNDDYSSDLRSCLTQADFTYFQSFVEIPANARINEAKLSIGPLDDGARVVIFNSSNPSGVAPREGYVLLGDTETADLSTYLKAGETNRIVIQHVDDCSAQGWLGTVELVVDGVGIQQGNKIAHSWGQLKQRYR